MMLGESKSEYSANNKLNLKVPRRRLESDFLLLALLLLLRYNG